MKRKQSIKADHEQILGGHKFLEDNQIEMEQFYNFLDKIVRFSIGEMGDYSGAMYNGDFSLTLEQAQRQKHDFVAKSLNITKGSSILDMGCGWGGMLKYFREIGAEAVGVALSPKQVASCRKNGFDVHLKDCRTIKPETFGKFDAAVSLGAFEHHCSRAEWEAGKHDEVYKDFFKTLHGLLNEGGRFYLQTMIYGKNMPAIEDISIHANKNSSEYLMALLLEYYKESWLPWSNEQLINCAKPYFKIINQNSGRLDYIETLKVWKKGYLKFNIHKFLIFASFLPRLILDKGFRYKYYMLKINPQRLCFEREIWEHTRLVFEKEENST